MLKRFSPHALSIAQALFVTFLWSTSWVLIKIGLKSIPALSFAGLRYSLALLFLLPIALRDIRRGAYRDIGKKNWFNLVLLGLLLYFVTQGAQFLSLAYLPASAVSLALSFTTALVALLGMIFLGEKPAPFQWLGLLVYLVGVGFYFYPFILASGQVIGLAIALVCVGANSLAAVLGRSINHSSKLEPGVITVVSMGIGAAGLLLVGGITQGLPVLTVWEWLIVLWLAAVNSAFAFTLWNRTLRHLSALESSMINNTMLFQISLLAWLFLGEALSGMDVIGLVFAVVGTLIVQYKPRSAVNPET